MPSPSEQKGVRASGSPAASRTERGLLLPHRPVPQRQPTAHLHPEGVVAQQLGQALHAVVVAVPHPYFVFILSAAVPCKGAALTLPPGRFPAPAPSLPRPIPALPSHRSARPPPQAGCRPSALPAAAARRTAGGTSARRTARPPRPRPGEDRGRERRPVPPRAALPASPPAAPRTASSSRISKTRLALPRPPSTASRLAASAGPAMLRCGAPPRAGPERSRVGGEMTSRTRAGYKMYTLLHLQVGYSAIPRNAAGAATNARRRPIAKERRAQLQRGARLRNAVLSGWRRRAWAVAAARVSSRTAPPRNRLCSEE